MQYLNSSSNAAPPKPCKQYSNAGDQGGLFSFKPPQWVPGSSDVQGAIEQEPFVMQRHFQGHTWDLTLARKSNSLINGSVGPVGDFMVP